MTYRLIRNWLVEITGRRRPASRLRVGADPAAMWLASLDSIPVCSEITRAEVLRGVRSAERAVTERLLGALRWLAVDERISRRAGELGRRYRRSHSGLAVADPVIAATVLELDASLATTNTRHYPMFARLRPPYDLDAT